MSFRSQATWLLSAIALAVCVAACNGVTPTIPSPAPTPTSTPTPGQGGVTVSGRVLDFTAAGDPRPVPNLRLKVRTGGSTDGAVGGVQLADSVTDSEGRYTITGVSAGILFFQTAPGSDYKFLCDWYPLIVRFQYDLAVVHSSWSGNQLPPAMWIIGTSVYGIVSERDHGNLVAVGGATVSLDNGIQDPPATTNANGFFMICSVVGTDQYRTLAAQKNGYTPVMRDILGGSDREFHFELIRR